MHCWEIFCLLHFLRLGIKELQNNKNFSSLICPSAMSQVLSFLFHYLSFFILSTRCSLFDSIDSANISSVSRIAESWESNDLLAPFPSIYNDTFGHTSLLHLTCRISRSTILARCREAAVMELRNEIEKLDVWNVHHSSAHHKKWARYWCIIMKWEKPSHLPFMREQSIDEQICYLEV